MRRQPQQKALHTGGIMEWRYKHASRDDGIETVELDHHAVLPEVRQDLYASLVLVELTGRETGWCGGK